jgi:hypothetical protein
MPTMDKIKNSSFKTAMQQLFNDLTDRVDGNDNLENGFPPRPFLLVKS